MGGTDPPLEGTHFEADDVAIFPSTAVFLPNTVNTRLNEVPRAKATRTRRQHLYADLANRAAPFRMCLKR